MESNQMSATSNNNFSLSRDLKQKGGNVFNSEKYSDTSFFNSEQNLESNQMSATSNNNSNFVSKYNQQILTGGNFIKKDSVSKYSVTSSARDQINSNLSETSEIIQNGGNSSSKLDVDIFKKSMIQSGGSKKINLKKKMTEIGINSTTTSSICE